MPTRWLLLESSLTHLCAAVASVSEDLMLGVFPNVTKTPAKNSTTNAIPASIDRRHCATAIPAPFSSLTLSPRELAHDTRSPSGGNLRAGAAQVVRMIITEQGAWREILSGTEPSRKALAPVL